ncbi:phosphotransferase [Streptomyces collinus]|uniref:phosphotransferase n=1 Tax=Streptomyces collinus TaxID=42684 RepID=UPI003688F609
MISDGTISGIVDLGDLCAGDPAADLAAAWQLLPQGADADFFGAYGETTKATVHRAQDGRCCQRLISSPSANHGNGAFPADSRPEAMPAAASLSGSSPSPSASRAPQLASQRERMAGCAGAGPGAVHRALPRAAEP